MTSRKHVRPFGGQLSLSAQKEGKRMTDRDSDKLYFDLMHDWMIDYLRFYVALKIFLLIWRHHHCRWRAKNLGLCSAIRAFEQGEIFIVPHLLWHGTSVFPVSSVYTSPFSRLLRHTMGCGGSILTWILTGWHLLKPAKKTHTHALIVFKKKYL
jgi:hypothetical protein